MAPRPVLSSQHQQVPGLRAARVELWLSLWCCCRDSHLWTWGTACGFKPTKSELTQKAAQSRPGWWGWLLSSCMKDFLLSQAFTDLSLFPIPSPHHFPLRCCGQTPPSLRSCRSCGFPLAFKGSKFFTGLNWAQLHWPQWAFIYSSKEFGIFLQIWLPGFSQGSSLGRSLYWAQVDNYFLKVASLQSWKDPFKNVKG